MRTPTPLMTGPDIDALANRLHVNPYYLAYALATGAGSCDAAFKRDGGNHEYIAWNDARWIDQAKAEGIRRELVSVQGGAVERHIAICAAHVPVADDSPRIKADLEGQKRKAWR